MKKDLLRLFLFMLAAVVLVACGSSQAELDAYSTQIAADVYAT